MESPPTDHTPAQRPRLRRLAFGVALLALSLGLVACPSSDMPGPSPAMVTLVVDADGDGRVRVDGALRTLPYERRAPVGTSVELEALPDAGAVFAGWDGDANGATNPLTLLLETAATVTALFEPAAPPQPDPTVEHDLQVTRDGDGTGSVSSAPGGLDCGGTCSARFAAGTTIDLTASPAGDSLVTGWVGCDTVSGDVCSLVLDDDRSVAVTFALLGMAASNDDLADRITLIGAQGSVSASTANASKEPGEPDHAGESGGASLWWAWTPPLTGSVAFDVSTSDVSAVIAVYTGSAMSDLTPVSASAAQLAARSNADAATIIFDVNAGDGPYLIAVDTVAGAEGVVRLRWATQAAVSWSLEPATLAFVGERGASAPPSQTLTLTNTGSRSSAFVVNTNAGWLNASPASGSLAVGESAPITLTVPACTNTGQAQATVGVSGGGVNAATTVNLTCEGASWQLQPSPLAFVSEGDDPVAPRTVTIRNDGNVTASFTLTPSAGWVQPSIAGGTLAPSAQTTFEVEVEACGGVTTLRSASIAVAGGGHALTLNVGHDCRVAPPLALSVDRVYINQSVPAADSAQSPSARIALVAGRAGLLRVFATASGSGAGQASATVHYRIGGGAETSVALSGPSTVPLSTSEGTLSTTYDVLLPAAAIQTGSEFYVEVNAVVGGTPVSVRYPQSGWWTPNVVTVPAANFTLVPVTYLGETASVSGAYLDLTDRMFPVASSSTQVRAAHAFNGNLNSGSGWVTLLEELFDLRAADGSNRHYVGIVDPQYGSGIVGIGYIGWPVAVSWSNAPVAYETVAHELGHNWNQWHTPCGNPPDQVSGFPHSNGSIGVWGYDRGTATLRAPSTPDVMGYCYPSWVSDFIYRRVLDFRRTGSFSVTTSAAPEPMLSVRGTLDDDGMRITQVLVDDRVPIASDGPYTLVAVDESGAEAARAAFDLIETSLHGVSVFRIDTPLRGAADVRLDRVWVERDGVILVERRQGVLPASIAPVTTERLADGGVRVQWDARAFPLVAIRDGRGGDLLVNGRTGDVVVHPSGSELELRMSDGLNTEVVTVSF